MTTIKQNLLQGNSTLILNQTMSKVNNSKQFQSANLNLSWDHIFDLDNSMEFKTIQQMLRD